MQITNQVTVWNDIKGSVRTHLANLSSPVDSFYEDHLLTAEFLSIAVDGRPAAVAAIHKQELLVYFTVNPGFRRWGQRLFQDVKQLRTVTSAFVPTCDEFYLSHAYEAARRVELQAYFFQQDTGTRPDRSANFVLRPAALDDKATIHGDTGDFFHDLDEHLAAGRIFVGLDAGTIVSYGIVEPSRILGSLASIGMIVKEAVRRQGYGRQTLLALQEHCVGQGIRPIAGCWYYNHQSKKTLESAGFYSATRLLKLHF